MSNRGHPPFSPFLGIARASIGLHRCAARCRIWARSTSRSAASSRTCSRACNEPATTSHVMSVLVLLSSYFLQSLSRRDAFLLSVPFHRHLMSKTVYVDVAVHVAGAECWIGSSRAIRMHVPCMNAASLTKRTCNKMLLAHSTSPLDTRWSGHLTGAFKMTVKILAPSRCLGEISPQPQHVAHALRCVAVIVFGTLSRFHANDATV